MSIPVLALEKVRKAFGSEVVLEDISITVPEHTATVFIGASGSGKSTLLRCINLLEQIDDGVIRLDGADITDPSVDPDEIRRKLGMVFQSFNLFPHMSVVENIILAPMRVHSKSREEAISEALELLDRFGLREKAEQYPDRLSGGQQQRVAIILSTVRDLKEHGMTMLLATHEMGFAKQVADEVCFLERGRILEWGKPEEILENPKKPQTQEFLKRVHEAGRL